MYKLFKLWFYFKIIYEIIRKITRLIGRGLKLLIKRNIFSEDNIIHKDAQ